MRRVRTPILSAIGAALLALTGEAGAAVPAAATARLSTSRPGARPVALVVTFRTELRCGRFAHDALSIRLPARARVPAAVPASAVSVGQRRAARVRVAGDVLTVELAAPKGVATCMVISEGPVTVAVSRAAGLGNPPRAGAYRLTVLDGAQTYVAPLAVR
jgi:hypothetical protein